MWVEEGLEKSHPSLSRALQWSAIAHALAFIFILTKSFLFPEETPKYVPTLRVDIVGLPDLLKQDLPKVMPDTPPADTFKNPQEADLAGKQKKKSKATETPEEIAKPEEMVVKSKKAAKEKDRQKKIESALQRMKALQRISESQDSEKPSSVLLKGNQISKGTSVSGDAKEQAGTVYLDQLVERVRSNWALPVWLARKNLKAQVEIQLDGRGRLTGVKFLSRSGNGQFDEAVRQAVVKSDPFLVPPTDLRGRLSDGIVLGFPL